MTHAEFIEALGGGTELAARLSGIAGEELDREAIYAWKARNIVPWKWRAPLLTVAKEQGVTAPADFLPGMVA